MDDGFCLKPILETESERPQHYGFRKKDYIEESIQKELIESKEQDGWEVIRINKKTARMKKPKPHFQLLEDRVWCLFYKMGFERLSGNNFRNNAKIRHNLRIKTRPLQGGFFFVR